MMEDRHRKLQALQDRIVECTKCPRLVAWREQVARERVKRFQDQTYWGRPITGFGDFDARLLLVGLAPAAHGGNRTGRIFTGDRSGDWLFETLHRFGFANQAESVSRDDGLRLDDCFITAAVRCAPPQNKPTREEKQNCFAYLCEEIELLPRVRVVVALGKIAFDTVFDAYRALNLTELRKRPKFAHGAEIALNERVHLLASYHPSQQNTFTGKLTRPMFDAVFRRAQALLHESDEAGGAPARAAVAARGA